VSTLNSQDLSDLNILNLFCWYHNAGENHKIKQRTMNPTMHTVPEIFIASTFNSIVTGFGQTANLQT
jgi:hypothetical protein